MALLTTRAHQQRGGGRARTRHECAEARGGAGPPGGGTGVGPLRRWHARRQASWQVGPLRLWLCGDRHAQPELWFARSRARSGGGGVRG
eukprot:scaffold124183_cov27-Phaeocystis_antarctica.AAC.1